MSTKVTIAAAVALALIGFAVMATSRGVDTSEPIALSEVEIVASGESSEPQVAGATAANNRTPAPAIELTRLNGEKFSLADYKGIKPVILDFWASWCHNCQRDMPQLSRLYEKYQDEVEVVGVNLQETDEKAQAFVDSYNISFPIVMDPSASVSQDYGIQYTNTHVLIDRQGKVVGVIAGDMNEGHMRTLIADSQSL